MKKSHFNSDAEAEPPSQEPAPSCRMKRLAKLSLAKKSSKPPRFSQPFLFPRSDAAAPIAPHPARTLISFKTNSRARAFYKYCYPNITSAEWNDWHWQLCNRITDIPGLSRFIMLSENESKVFTHHGGQLPISITPYYASLIDAVDVAQPLRRTVVPAYDEFIPAPGESSDPLAEDQDSPVPGIVHRYPDRALFLVTGCCFTHCRYCTRSRIVGNETKDCYMQEHWEQALSYIAAHPEIRDVLLSGGDPLTLEDENLEWLLTRLRRIPHVEFIRVGTKAPMVLPQRITHSLTRMLKRFHPLWLSIHVTHPEELTPEANQACGRLADAGIPLGSQTVLLAGVNDSVATMKELVHGLLRVRVKPYYLYQCDPIHGSSHFRTPVEKGLEIIQGLRGHTTGYAVPTFVVDAPGGGGKIPLVPDYVMGREGDDLLLKNYAGATYRYPDPGGTVGRK
jgi:lysine 2,3-aminomutase